MMKKILIGIASVVLVLLALWAPWLSLDNGEDIMESQFFRAKDKENFKYPRANCECDGSCLQVKWVPFGMKVDACSYDYYFIAFWGQRFYFDGK